MARSKAMNDGLVILEGETQDVRRDALSTLRLSAAIVEISERLNRRVAEILRET